MDNFTRRSRTVTKIVIRIIICIVALILLYACYVGIESRHIKTGGDYSKTLICIKSEEGTLENAGNKTVTYYGFGVKVRWIEYNRYSRTDGQEDFTYIGKGSWREFYVFNHLWWDMCSEEEDPD